ncbi:MAG: isoprenylcysteine carboxylmethyltransferase family protein [Gammaproteobacteria bacterium]|nr:isoprenylcysteine carboxylmethyltransferase family protein [Gammaproteobacteria bacterium]
MALLLATCFVLFAIVARVLIHYHFTGDHGIRLAKPNAPLIEILPGSFFILSFIVSLLLILFEHLELLNLYYALPPPLVLIGTVLGLTGIAIIVIAQWQMGHAWRIGVDQSERTELIVTGLYTRSRNPIYLGILMYWVGLVMVFPHLFMLICALVCWLCIELIVRKIEEPFLRRLHGQAYDDYCSRTNRYLL